MGRELELKYVATPEKLAAVCQMWDNWTSISMQTTYFDTSDEQLSQQHCTLRCRMENGISVCTLKTPISGLGRGEWEKHTDWCAETVAELFRSAGRSPIAFDALRPVCGAKFTRRAKTVVLPDCTVEIALDEGMLLGGGREIPLYELEVEFKSGDENAAILWAKALAAKFGLQAETKSKFRQASLLAKGEYYG